MENLDILLFYTCFLTRSISVLYLSAKQMIIIHLKIWKLFPAGINEKLHFQSIILEALFF